jgi:hypothetical protein
VPEPIRPHLAGHEVRTAAEEGWDTLKNGELLTAAEQAGFDALLTTDKNIRYQQNLSQRKIAIVRARSTTMAKTSSASAIGG